jgi:hypothetical protein
MNHSSQDPEVQKLVDKIIMDNDASKLKELSIDLNESNKSDVITAVRKLDMSPLSTDSACG